MSVVLDENKRQFELYIHIEESAFEAIVKKLAEHIFGPTSIYLDIKRRVKGKEIISIPDGYLIDLTDPTKPRLYIVENEIVSHDPFKHVGSQLLRFAVSFEDAQTEIRHLLMQEIQAHDDLLKRFETACKKSSFRNIDNYLDAAVYTTFHGLVIIDEARPELNRVLEKINADINILELKTFISDDGSFIYQFDTLYEESEEGISSEEDPQEVRETRLQRRARRAKSDTIIVPAREEGFKRVFLGENSWYQIRISPAMKERIKYIAAYQVAPISAVTYIAEVKDIKPYKDTGYYQVFFLKPAEKIGPVPIKDPKRSPQSAVYVQRERLLKAVSLEEALDAP